MQPNTIVALTALPLLIASSLSSISQVNNHVQWHSRSSTLNTRT